MYEKSMRQRIRISAPPPPLVRAGKSKLFQPFTALYRTGDGSLRSPRQLGRLSVPSEIKNHPTGGF